jgi:hypothetical protein
MTLFFLVEGEEREALRVIEVALTTREQKQDERAHDEQQAHEHLQR